MHVLFQFLFLPFRLLAGLLLPLRIIKNLFFKLAALIMGPLLFLHKPFMWVAIIATGAYFIMEGLDSRPDKKHTAVDLTKDGAYSSTLVEPVTKTEDGNSVYSQDLLDNMNPDEFAYYSHAFNWTMSNVEDNTALPWEKFNIAGTLTPTLSFESSLGTQCRRFKETLKVHQVQQTLSGIACKNNNGGWCKLRENSTPNCDLGFASPWERTKMNFGTNINRAINKLF